jgi:hypothetical protein
MVLNLSRYKARFTNLSRCCMSARQISQDMKVINIFDIAEAIEQLQNEWKRSARPSTLDEMLLHVNPYTESHKGMYRMKLSTLSRVYSGYRQLHVNKALSPIHTHRTSLQHALSLPSLLCFSQVPSAPVLTFTACSSDCRPRTQTSTNSQSKSRYDWRSVSQYVKVSSPLWNFFYDSFY